MYWDLGRVGSQSSGVHGKPATISLHGQVLRPRRISSTAEADPEPASWGARLDIVNFTGYVLGRGRTASRDDGMDADPNYEHRGRRGARPPYLMRTSDMAKVQNWGMERGGVVARQIALAVPYGIALAMGRKDSPGTGGGRGGTREDV